MTIGHKIRCLWLDAMNAACKDTCHTLTFNISVFFIFWLGQGVMRVGMLVFVLSRVFVCLGVL